MTHVLERMIAAFVDIQARLLTLITHPCYHSLESDLRALYLSRPRSIDTTLTFHYPCGGPLKLSPAWHILEWLGRTTQDHRRADTISSRMSGFVWIY